MWPRTCISCAVIVSAPASSALHLPALSLPASVDSKDPSAAKAIPFKNVFDSLTLFDDLESESGARQGSSSAVPNSPSKKESPDDSGTGTEDVSVLAATTVPQIPIPSLPKAALILAPSVKIAMPGTEETLEQALADPSTPTQVRSGAVSQLIAKNQAGPDATPPSHASLHSSLSYSPLAKFSLPNQAEVDAPPAQSAPSSAPAPSATPVNPAAVAAATAAPTKSRVTMPSVAVPARVTTDSAEQSARPANPATTKLAVKPVSVPPDRASVAPSLPPSAPPTQEQAVANSSTPASVPTKVPSSKVVASQPIATAASRVVQISTPTKRELTSKTVTTPRAQGIPTTSPQLKTAPQRTDAAIRVSALTAQAAALTQPPAVTMTRSNKASIDKTSIDKTPVDKTDSTVLSLPVSNAPQAATPEASRAPLSKPAPQAAPVSSPAVLPDATPHPVSVTTPVSAAQPEAPIASTGNASNQDPVPVQADRQPTSAADTISPALPVASLEQGTPAPPSDAHDVATRASETPSKAPIPQSPALAAAPPKPPLVPQAENFAFAVRMLGLEGTSERQSPTLSEPTTPSKTAAATDTSQPSAALSQGRVTQPQIPDSQQPAPPSDSQPATQTASDPRHAAQSAAPETDKSDTGVKNQPELLGAQQNGGQVAHWNDAPVSQASEWSSTGPITEPADGTHGNLPLAAQESHLPAPEMPKTSASSEILLHLTNDQSAAAIRVADRAGSVSVSVHASDPVLRESLRSNLGDLSTQLSDQGWKADVTKPVAMASQSGSQQDSHEGGQRGSQQQQSFGGDRPPQRDRRASGGQWQQELDQQIPGGDAHPGGNR